MSSIYTYSLAFVCRMLVFVSIITAFTFLVSCAAKVTSITEQEAALAIKDVDNFHKVSDVLYRSGQPSRYDFFVLEKQGIKTVLNLRYHHEDDIPQEVKLQAKHLPMNAGSLTKKEIVDALHVIRDSPKPVLVHCWHGSDRTGAICAAYKIVFMDCAVDATIDEMVNGGYGFHGFFYKNIPELMKGIDWEQLKAELVL